MQDDIQTIMMVSMHLGIQSLTETIYSLFPLGPMPPSIIPISWVHIPSSKFVAYYMVSCCGYLGSTPQVVSLTLSIASIYNGVHLVLTWGTH